MEQHGCDSPDRLKHCECDIIYATSKCGYANDGWFPETDIEQVHTVLWFNKQIEKDKGVFCIGRGSDGIIWVHDGMDRIAAVNEWRVQHYLYRGISYRFNKLLRDYLGNGLIEIPEGAQVINFGANIGEVALALNRKGARVLAIEPDPNVLPALKANARGRLIEVENVVAWKEDGEIDLYIATEKGDTSVINRSDDLVKTTARRIDSLAAHYGTIHLIVGDAEGAEPEVLQGATETLKRTKYVSIRVGKERNGTCPGPECREILDRAGFEILVDEGEILIGRNKSV